MPSRVNPLLSLLFLTVTGLTACSLSTRPTQPAVMATTRVTMPPEQLRLRTIEQAANIAGIVELAADDILAATTDPAVRRNALLWKANAIPAIQSSVVQFDPLVSFVDLFALCIQADDFFGTGAGRDAFGPQQDRARRATAQALASTRQLGAAIAPDSEGLARGEAAATRWAREHPIESLAFARQTMTTVAASAVLGGDASALAAVGRLDQNVTDLNTRVALLMAYLPKQIRWEAQLLIEQLLAGGQVDTALADLGSLTRSVDRLTAVAESVPGLADWQRRAVMEAVTAERVASFETLSEQLTRLLTALTEERTAAIRDVEGVLVRTLQESQATWNAAMDHLVWRLTQLVAVLFVLGAAGLGILAASLRRREARLPPAA